MVHSGVRIICVRTGIIFIAFNAIQESKRLVSPEEISSAVYWLLSEGFSYVVGSVKSVDGDSAYHFLPLIEI